MGGAQSSLTSAAETKESVEAMLMLSLRQMSSRSSLDKMSAILSGKKNDHVHSTAASMTCVCVRLGSRWHRTGGLTLAVAVGRRLRHTQHSLKLLLEAIRPLQQRLEPVDELCTDDVLFTKTASFIRVH